MSATIIFLAIHETRQYIVTHAGSEEVPSTAFDELSQGGAAIQPQHPGAQRG